MRTSIFKPIKPIMKYISVTFILCYCINYSVAQNNDTISILNTNPGDKAIVVILRPDSKRFLTGNKIFCDDRYIGETGKNEFIYTVLPPGKHDFVVTAKRGRSQILEILVEQNKLYFITQYYSSGPKLKILSEANGLEKLSLCTLSDNCIETYPLINLMNIAGKKKISKRAIKKDYIITTNDSIRCLITQENNETVFFAIEKEDKFIHTMYEKDKILRYYVDTTHTIIKKPEATSPILIYRLIEKKIREFDMRISAGYTFSTIGGDFNGKTIGYSKYVARSAGLDIKDPFVFPELTASTGYFLKGEGRYNNLGIGLSFQHTGYENGKARLSYFSVDGIRVNNNTLRIDTKAYLISSKHVFFATQFSLVTNSTGIVFPESADLAPKDLHSLGFDLGLELTCFFTKNIGFSCGSTYNLFSFPYNDRDPKYDIFSFKEKEKKGFDDSRGLFYYFGICYKFNISQLCRNKILFSSFHIGGLWASFAVRNVEFNFLSFFQNSEAITFNTCVMHKYIVSLFGLNKSIAFSRIKPFYFAFHDKKN
jgi:hypothetical protein